MSTQQNYEDSHKRFLAYLAFSFLVGCLDLFALHSSAIDVAQAEYWKVAATSLFAVSGFALTVTGFWVTIIYKDLLVKTFKEQESLTPKERIHSQNFGYALCVSAFNISLILLAVLVSPFVIHKALGSISFATHGARILHAFYVSASCLQLTVFIFALLPFFIGQSHDRKKRREEHNEQMTSSVPIE